MMLDPGYGKLRESAPYRALRDSNSGIAITKGALLAV